MDDIIFYYHIVPLYRFDHIPAEIIHFIVLEPCPVTKRDPVIGSFWEIIVRVRTCLLIILIPVYFQVMDVNPGTGIDCPDPSPIPDMARSFIVHSFPMISIFSRDVNRIGYTYRLCARGERKNRCVSIGFCIVQRTLESGRFHPNHRL